MIDYTITVGDLVQISVIAVGVLAAFFQVKSWIQSLSKDVTVMKEDIKVLSKSFTELAVVNNRIKNVEEDIRELRHGRGFIREAIEGEWPQR